MNFLQWTISKYLASQKKMTAKVEAILENLFFGENRITQKNNSFIEKMEMR